MGNREHAPPVTLYALQTCTHCRRTKKYLEHLNIPFKTVYMDMLVGAERNDALRRVRRLNPSVTFPTLLIGDKVVVGFKQNEIDAALESV